MNEVPLARVALVHEWFVEYAGSERVFAELCELYPEAEIFCVFATKDALAQWPCLQGRRVHQSFVSRLPGVARHYRKYLPFMPIAIEQLDLSGFDIVISSSHAVAKGVLVGPDQLHVSYVHSPVRYAWDLQHQYLRESGMDSGPVSWLARWLLHRLRIWDQRTAQGVDRFVANSAFIARRIAKAYRREATVVYPPVDTSAFEPGVHENRGWFYLAASRLVPYKRMDVLLDAFEAMPERRLVVIGGGAQYERLKRKASANVEMLGHQSFDVLLDHMQRARAFLFAAEEDFGIMPVEAQACGTPVIAFGRGGACESVVPLGCASPTGLFFDRQAPSAVVQAVERFEEAEGEITSDACRRNAVRFSAARFRQEMRELVDDSWQQALRQRSRGTAMPARDGPDADA